MPDGWFSGRNWRPEKTICSQCGYCRHLLCCQPVSVEGIRYWIDRIGGSYGISVLTSGYTSSLSYTLQIAFKVCCIFNFGICQSHKSSAVIIGSSGKTGEIRIVPYCPRNRSDRIILQFRPGSVEGFKKVNCLNNWFELIYFQIGPRIIERMSQCMKDAPVAQVFHQGRERISDRDHFLMLCRCKIIDYKMNRSSGSMKKSSYFLTYKGSGHMRDTQRPLYCIDICDRNEIHSAFPGEFVDKFRRSETLRRL